MKTFFTATLTNDTPVFLGGYDTNYAREDTTEGLRTQSLKGLIRYWVRVYLATAGYDLKEINERVCKLLGGKLNNDMYSSKIRLSCYTNTDTISSINDEFNYELKGVPRIYLLTKSKDLKDLNFADRLEAKVKLQYVNNNLSEKDKRLVIGSLTTGLLLSGLGKMSRRGFGCFSMRVEEDDTRLFRTKINDLFSDIDHNERIKIIKDIIRYTKDSIDKIVSSKDNIPEIHSLSNCKIFYIPLKKKILKEIRFFQRFTVRGYRVMGLGKDPRRFKDEITKNRLAWFMGLPRSSKQEKKQNKKTGYLVKQDGQDRRASPMFIAIHKQYALVSFFKSKDWPNEIEWKGGNNKSIPIQPLKNIDNAFQTTINLFKSYIQKNGYEVLEVE